MSVLSGRKWCQTIPKSSSVPEGDLFLLDPTPTAMHKMLSICDEYGKEFSIKFNAMKSK